MQKADGHTSNPFCLQGGYPGFEAGLVQRHQHLTPRIHAFEDRQAKPPGHQRFGQIDIEIVLLVAVFIAHLYCIAEPLRGDQCGRRPFVLDQQVGGESGAVDNRRHCLRFQTGSLQDIADSGEDATLGRVVSG